MFMLIRVVALDAGEQKQWPMMIKINRMFVTVSVDFKTHGI